MMFAFFAILLNTAMASNATTSFCCYFASYGIVNYRIRPSQISSNIWIDLAILVSVIAAICGFIVFVGYIIKKCYRRNVVFDVETLETSQHF